MKEQTINGDQVAKCATSAQSIPVDPELQEMVLKVYDCRKRLRAYADAIHDQRLYLSIEDSFTAADECLVNAITSISKLAANEMISRLVDDIS